MKLPTSSSLLFATLAISSSSSTLAAPAVDAPQYDADIASSSSNNHVPSPQESCHKLPASDGQGQEELLWLGETTVANACSSIGGVPVVGPIAEAILCPPLASNSAQVSPQTMQALQAAVNEVSRLIANTTVVPAPSNSTRFSSNPAASSPSAAASGLTAPSSPSMPINPPNSPAPALPSAPATPSFPGAPAATPSPPGTTVLPSS